MNPLILFFTISLFSLDLWASEKIIYGEDNRQDWFMLDNGFIKEQALSVAAMIPKQNLIEKDDYFIISALSLRGRGICPDELFTTQLTAARCSAFMVTEDLLVTAGNCVSDLQECQNHAWVFDYRMKFKNDKTSTVDREHVYQCQRIIERKFDPLTLENYALIQLDRKVEQRIPLKLNIKGPLYRRTSLYSIGHPNGLPVKISDNAEVKTIFKKYFRANLDSFSESNGSPVLNQQTGLVEGIISSKHQLDYISNNGCQRLNRTGQNSGLGEIINYIGNINSLRNLDL